MFPPLIFISPQLRNRHRPSFQLQDALRKHIFHLAWSPDSLPTVDAMAPLMDYLDKNLAVLNARLLKGNYIRALHVIWESVLAELAEHSDVSGGVSREGLRLICSLCVHIVLV